MLSAQRLHLVIIIGCLMSCTLSAAPEAAKTTGLLADNYKLQPLDVIQLIVFKEPDLDQQVRLSQDGTVNLSLVGNLKLSGLSINEAGALIAKQYYDQEFLVDPQIALNLISYTERRAYVHGQVNQPGPVVIPPEETLTLSQVISAAGSLTRLASYKIRVTHFDEGGKKTVNYYHFQDVLEDPEANDVIIQHGDSIYVPESWI